VGPSGSGKSTVARHLWPGLVQRRLDWPADKSVVDGFPDVPIQQIVESLSAVGFSSPPSWCKPFAVLSNGERFRVELARAMIEAGGLFVVDEFTSVVDRTVAQIGSHAISKAIRRRGGQMVALSCHYDIVDWLEPDWTLDLKDNTFLRRRLRRPDIEIEIRTVPRSIWRMFAPHHYLTGTLHKAAACFGAFWGEQITAFGAVMQMMGRKGYMRVHRLVVLPDYQGVGIGRALLRVMGEHYHEKGKVLRISSSHPAIVKGLKRDLNWRCCNYYPHGTTPHSGKPGMGTKGRRSLFASYEYRVV